MFAPVYNIGNGLASLFAILGALTAMFHGGFGNVMTCLYILLFSSVVLLASADLATLEPRVTAQWPFCVDLLQALQCHTYRGRGLTLFFLGSVLLGTGGDQVNSSVQLVDGNTQVVLTQERAGFVVFVGSFLIFTGIVWIIFSLVKSVPNVTEETTQVGPLVLGGLAARLPSSQNAFLAVDEEEPLNSTGVPSKLDPAPVTGRVQLPPDAPSLPGAKLGIRADPESQFGARFVP